MRTCSEREYFAPWGGVVERSNNHRGATPPTRVGTGAYKAKRGQVISHLACPRRELNSMSGGGRCNAERMEPGVLLVI